MITPQDLQAQEAHTRNLLARMSIPSLTWLSEEDPVRQLQARINFQAQPGSVMDVISLSYIAPVECLNAFIWLLENAKWGEFWELYFERMVPRDVLANYGALIGCKAMAKYLREESVAGLGDTPLTQIQNNAKRLMLPLADEIYALGVFFQQRQAITQPQRGTPVSHEQLLGRRVMMGSAIIPSSQPSLATQSIADYAAAAQGTTTNENSDQPGEMFVKGEQPVVPQSNNPDEFVQRTNAIIRAVGDPSAQAIMPEDLPYHIPSLIRGYGDVRTDHLAQALLDTRIDWPTLVSSMPHTWPLSPAASRALCDFNTLAKVLLEIKRIGGLGTLRTEDDVNFLEALTKGLFMDEAYLVAGSEPHMRASHISTALWGLVVSCGYNFYKPERRCVTATGWKVRGTLLARVVLEDYIGDAACPLLNSNKGNITRYGVAPQEPCWNLGYFPQVLAKLTK